MFTVQSADIAVRKVNNSKCMMILHVQGRATFPVHRSLVKCSLPVRVQWNKPPASATVSDYCSRIIVPRHWFLQHNDALHLS